MRFRNCPDKRFLTGKVPEKVSSAFRGVVYEHRSTISEVLTEAICRHVDLDPREFGISKNTRVRRPRPESATTAAP